MTGVWGPKQVHTVGEGTTHTSIFSSGYQAPEDTQRFKQDFYQR